MADFSAKNKVKSYVFSEEAPSLHTNNLDIWLLLKPSHLLNNVRNVLSQVSFHANLLGREIVFFASDS